MTQSRLLLIDRHGGIRGPESETIHHLPSRFRGLAENGTLLGGLFHATGSGRATAAISTTTR